jgi:hypothetical protein
MPHRLTVAAAFAVALLAPAARAEPARVPAGRVESEEGQLEVLGRPLHAGDRIELPEGFLVVEEDAPDDGAVGSFGVLSSEVSAPLAPAAPAATEAPALEAPGAEQARAEAASLALPGAGCRAERSAYLSELWRASGIDVEDPVALLDGLAAGTGAAAGFYWFALSTDAFRPLAWSSELRTRADALARCARGR